MNTVLENYSESENNETMTEQTPIDAPSSPGLNPFKLIAIGFLLGSSIGMLEWIFYRTIQDLFILIDATPINTLWFSNSIATVMHVTIVLIMYRIIRKKLTARTLNWEKLLDHSKYLLAITVLINIFFLVYWDSFLPPSFFDALELHNYIASESLIFIVLPFLFSIFNVFFVLILLKRLAEKMK